MNLFEFVFKWKISEDILWRKQFQEFYFICHQTN